MQHLITDNIDVWTGAYAAKSSAGRGSSNKLNLHGIKKLRELILELAVRGKLVPQNTDDEPASVLLERIATEKARLVAEGKIKKQKPLPSVGEDEKPFGLPTGWEWVRLGAVGQIVGGGTPKSAEPSFWADSEGGINWLTPADLYGLKEKYIATGRRNITPLGLSKSSAQLLPKGTILFSSRAPIGYVAIAEEEVCTNQGFKSCVPFETKLSGYIYQFLKRSAKYIDAAASGTTFKEVSGTIISLICVPLPPLSELQRIDAKIDELMALCDQLEQQQTNAIAAHATLVETLLTTLTNSTTAQETKENWNRIAEHFDTLFTTEHSIDQLKQTILQLAVMGKLVPQNPDDEPASVLLGRIADEKAQLVKEGKIKKQKPLPPINDDEKPFGLPSGWERCRFGDIFQELKYGTSQKSDYGIDGAPVLRIPNIVKGYVDSSDLKYSKLSEKDMELYRLREGDLLQIRSNGSSSIVGSAAIVDKEHEGFVYAGYLVRVRFNAALFTPSFLLLALQSKLLRVQIEGPLRTTSGVKNINSTEISNLIMPSVPFDEQHRIVAKVNELTTLCDQLKTRIQQTQQTNLHLADTVVERALA